MNTSVKILGLLIVGAIIGAVTMRAVSPMLGGQTDSSTMTEVKDSAGDEKKPLYWVAPMDPKYKRDKPGKSPMGMDLIPVYKEEGGDSDAGPGTIKISPDVVNNLGVRRAPAQRKVLHTEIKTVGYVKYDEDQLVHIHPRVEGWVEKLYVKASGDPVEKGQPLYNIYSPQLVNAQEELLLALDRKSPRLVKAAENRLAALRVPEAAIKQLLNTKEVQQTITFYAPQGGVVDNLQIRQGFFVKPGTTIMSIGTLKQVWVEAEVFESQVFQVAVGLPVTMTLDYLPGREWDGVVNYIYPTLDAKTRTVRVRLRFDNENELLKPDMFAQVVIHADSQEKTLVVPREAVIRTGRVDKVVLALEGGRFKSIIVKVGRFDKDSAEILSGLKEGEEVVTSAQFLLDSESSKTSDFIRMNHDETAMPDRVWAQATINSLIVERRSVNVTHQAISQWKWPEMTMDFTVAESVDMSSLKKGMALAVEILRTQGDQYQITNIRLPGNDDPNKNLDDLSLDGMSLDNMSQGDGEKSDHK